MSNQTELEQWSSEYVEACPDAASAHIKRLQAAVDDFMSFYLPIDARHKCDELQSLKAKHAAVYNPGLGPFPRPPVPSGVA